MPPSAPQKKIGEHTFSFGMLPAETALEVMALIVKRVAEPLLVNIVGNIEENSAEPAAPGAPAAPVPKNEDGERAILFAIGAVASRLEPKELIQIARLLAKQVSCDGVPETHINEIFTGAPKDMMLFLAEALKVNFASFFGGKLSRSIGAKIQKAATSRGL